MCAIFGSCDISEFLNLSELNSARGGTSYSIMGLDSHMGISFLDQSDGKFDVRKAEEAFRVSEYCIGHIQAPTMGKTSDYNIHPAHYGSKYLYHNGMVRSQALAKYPDNLSNWDTLIILKEIVNSKDISKTLESIEGSFACILVDAEINTVELFTNKSCILYINSRTCTISSTKFAKSKRLAPEKIFKFNPVKKLIDETSIFKSFDDIYFIAEETNARKKQTSKTTTSKA